MKTKISIFIFVFFIFTSMNLFCQSSGIGGKLHGVGGVIGGPGDVISGAGAVIGAGESTHSAKEEITPEQEYYLGRAVAANILSTYKIWNGNQALTNYLNQICAAITFNSPKPYIYNGYHVAILDSNEINAFATPGGHIFVTKGLINAAKLEDALAAVIAHEVAHIQLQHGIEAIKNDRFGKAIGTGFVAAGEIFGVSELTNIFSGSVGEISKTLINGYPPAQEFSADKTAMSLLASACYNPQSLIDMLQVLGTAQTAGVGLSKTHPTPVQRVTEAQKTVGSYRVTDTSSSRQARFNAMTK